MAAFGGTLKMLPEKESGVREVEVISQEQVFEGITTLRVYEDHRWVAESVPEPLVALAKSGPWR